MNYLIYKLAYSFLDSNIQEEVEKDIDRYLLYRKERNNNFSKKLKACTHIPAFKAVFYYRLTKSRKRIIKIIKKLFNFLQLNCKSIEIGGDIKGGLLIQHHGIGSVVFVKSAGENFQVGPGVVIGRNRDNFPIIGDNVYVGANASIIGDVKIGSNVKIGAGSVVVKDIADDCTVVGNPAKIIKARGLES